MNRNHLKFLSSQLGGAKQRRRTNGTHRRSTFATASFILIVGLLAVLLAACPSASADTTPPTFELSAISPGTNVTELTIVASEPITLLGTTAADHISKLAVKNDVNAVGVGTTVKVENVVLNNDAKTVKLTIDFTNFVAGEDVSVVVGAGFAADKAATPNENVAATLEKVTVADTTPPTFTLNPIAASTGITTLTIVANEPITLLGADAAAKSGKLTVTNGGTEVNVTDAAFNANLNDEMTVEITIESTDFETTKEVSVTIAEGFAADKATEPNNNEEATVARTVS